MKKTDLVFAKKSKNPLFKDIEGGIFNRLLVLGYAGKFNKQKQTYWWCECSCENKIIVKVASSLILSSSVKSCGCLNTESISKLNKKI